MTIEEMNFRKKELGYTYEQIAELSGLPVSTVQKTLGGFTKSPRYETLRALESVFLCSGSDLLKEPAAYGSFQKEKKPGDYTIEDYYAVSEDRRTELIHGTIYDLASPSGVHQMISGELYTILKEYIRKNHGNCIPLYAPFDVQLNCDHKTMVQPDLFVLCDRKKFFPDKIVGAPDLIIEILSPSTKGRDMYTKMALYFEAGVREYWLVDPERERVVVYEYEKQDVAVIYTFQDKIPVGIFDGKCVVDFAEIGRSVGFLWELS